MKISPIADVEVRLSACANYLKVRGLVVNTRGRRPVDVLLAPHNAENPEHLLVAHSPPFSGSVGKLTRDRWG